MSALLLGAVLVLHEPLRNVTLSVLRFPFAVVNACTTILITLPHLPALTHENAALRAELIQRRLEIAHLQELVRHAEQAQALLHDAPASQGIVAAIIGRSTIPTQQTIVLDKGKRDGVTLDSVIVDAFGVIGRVVELYSTTCLVMLLTDSESRVAGLVDRSRESGLLVGGDRGLCEFLYLDIGTDIQAEDRIVTAGLGGIFPKGLTLGKVVRVAKDEQAGTASAWVEPAARLGQLEEVLCLPPSLRGPDREEARP